MNKVIPKILIIDDDRTVCKSLQLLLQQEGFEVRSIYRPDNALEHIHDFNPQLILLDMNFTIDTSGIEGLRVLGDIKRAIPSLPVILMTGWGSMELAVTGMKAGANDFIPKPWDNQNLVETIRSHLTLLNEHTKEISAALDRIVGNSPPILEIKRMIQKIAPTDAMVLISGESGTGKELVAEAIHDLSHRADGPFVKVNLGGLSQTLFESELFGHKKGAFTGAVADREGRFKRADGGSIFLDEIGEVPIDLQVKLLRVLQEKSYEPLGSSASLKANSRVLSATHQNLEALVANNKFREDLYYRINLMQIRLPSLAERRSDIPLIVKHILSNLNVIYPERDLGVSEDALMFLSNQSYPGNIRQLKNIVERTYLLANKKKLLLNVDDFKNQFAKNPSTNHDVSIDNLTLEEMESMMVSRALKRKSGNISAAAQSLGITRSALYRRMDKYGLERE